MGERPPWRRRRHRPLDPRGNGRGGRRERGRGAQARAGPHQRPWNRRDAPRGRGLRTRGGGRARAWRPHPDAEGLNGSGAWHAEQAWLGRPARDVLIQVRDGRIESIAEGVPAPAGAIVLTGWTVPGLANVHSHAFQRALRGKVEAGGGDFWEWRRVMYETARRFDPDAYLRFAIGVFREMLAAGITAVGEFHYLHGHGNAMGEMLIGAARLQGIRITLI